MIPAPLRAALILYHLSQVLSSTFFQILFTFPKVSSGTSFTRPLRRLNYYTTSVTFCQIEKALFVPAFFVYITTQYDLHILAISV